MSEKVELESTFLAASIPPNLDSMQRYLMRDVYFPAGSPHPRMRIRQQGSDKFELTKKTRLSAVDSGKQREQNIELEADEFAALAQGDGAEVSKVRHLYPYGDVVAEIDVFKNALTGLVLIDFEFESQEQRAAFQKPDFCGPEVTQENILAGGMLAGKSYADIADDLARLGYSALDVAELISER